MVSEAKLRSIFAAMDDVILVLDGHGCYLEIAPTNPNLLYRPAQNLLGKTLNEVFPAEQAETFLQYIQTALSTRQKVVAEYNLQVNGEELWFSAAISPMMEDTVVWVARDITECKQAEKAVAANEVRIRSLILNSTDVITIHDQNGVIKFATPSAQRILGYAPEDLIGLNAFELTHPEDRENLGKEFASVVERTNPGTWTEYRIRHAEGSWLYIETLGINLLMQPGVEGIVLTSRDVTQRKQIEMELREAYEATIEGWSMALDMRDKETEGHTQRVVKTTLALAKAMGLGESELVHIRRGALLHDIGKMSIPDSILLKPGSLTPEEKAIMQQHPQNAYQMLSHIAYLKPALDIPYCHHERWDGSGYPRGLKGEAIPLSARIFTVVDVYDALTSDRPYRKHLTDGEAIQYIRTQAGQQFDPDVVQVFLNQFAAMPGDHQQPNDSI